jgi:hypothetical protein
MSTASPMEASVQAALSSHGLFEAASIAAITPGGNGLGFSVQCESDDVATLVAEGRVKDTSCESLPDVIRMRTSERGGASVETRSRQLHRKAALSAMGIPRMSPPDIGALLADERHIHRDAINRNIDLSQACLSEGPTSDPVAGMGVDPKLHFSVCLCFENSMSDQYTDAARKTTIIHGMCLFSGRRSWF